MHFRHVYIVGLSFSTIYKHKEVYHRATNTIAFSSLKKAEAYLKTIDEKSIVDAVNAFHMVPFDVRENDISITRFPHFVRIRIFSEKYDSVVGYVAINTMVIN